MEETYPFSAISLSPAEDITVSLAKFPEPGDVLKVVSEVSTPGGKGLNLARWLASRRHPTLVSGIIGADYIAPFETMMAKYGIRDALRRVPGPSRRNVMYTSPEGMFKVNRQPFPNLSEKDWDLDEIAGACTAFSSVCMLAGALPPGMPQDTYATLIRKLREAGATAVLDSSGEALRHGVEAHPCIIKPNREECTSLLGRRLDTADEFRDAVLELLEKCECVLVSDGPRGCWFGEKRGGETRVFHGGVADVKVVDTTAAGDALLAEFCHRYFPGREVNEEVIRYACAAGAAATTTPGAETPPMEFVDSLASSIKVTRVV